MNLTTLGIIFIAFGIILLVLTPLAVLQTHGPLTSAGSLACIVILFIPICFSAGIQPTLAIILVTVIMLIFALLTFIIYKVFKNIGGTTGF